MGVVFILGIIFTKATALTLTLSHAWEREFSDWVEGIAASSR